MDSSIPFSAWRGLSRALLSIRPQFAFAILDGRKGFEFRRTRFLRPVDVVVIYATKPVGQVIGEFEVADIIVGHPESLWRRTRGSGIDEETFRRYFTGVREGFAIQVGRTRRYPYPFCPEEEFGIRAPQSFAYLRGVNGLRGAFA